MLFVIITIALLLTLVQSKDHPPLDKISIRGLTHEHGEPSGNLAVAPESSLDTGGTGCQDGSVVNVFNSDKTLLTLIFSDFTALLEPGSPRAQQRRFCAVNLAFEVPANWTFEVEQLEWRGYADLDRGVRAVLRSVYFWRGDRESEDRSTVRKVVEGPVQTDLTKTKTGEKDRSVWLPCTRETSVLHINTMVRLCYDGVCNEKGREGANAKGAKKTGKGTITIDSLDAKFKQTLQLGWKKC